MIVDFYSVYVKPQGGSYSIYQTVSELTDLSYTLLVDPAETGNSFMFQITATNEVGESERSIAATVIAGTVPGEVTDLVTVHADV